MMENKFEEKKMIDDVLKKEPEPPLKNTWSDKLLITGYFIVFGSWLYKYNAKSESGNLIQWIFLATMSISLIYIWDNSKYFKNDRLRIVAPLILMVIALSGMLWHG